jgi:hypothetical protein
MGSNRLDGIISHSSLIYPAFVCLGSKKWAWRNDRRLSISAQPVRLANSSIVKRDVVMRSNTSVALRSIPTNTSINSTPPINNWLIWSDCKWLWMLYGLNYRWRTKSSVRLLTLEEDYCLWINTSTTIPKDQIGLPANLKHTQSIEFSASWLELPHISPWISLLVY